MSTVSDLLGWYGHRIDSNDTNLYGFLNLAIRMIYRRLYAAKSKLVQGDLSVSIFDQVTVTGTDIAFVDSDPDTITSVAAAFGDFQDGMIITTDFTTNPGPYDIDTAAAATLTLDSDESLTAQAAGSSYTITSVDAYGRLPSDFWGLIGKPYLNGYTRHLYPLPDERTRLLYSTAGDPLYYEIQGTDRIYTYPPTGTDHTINGKYFVKPTRLTAGTDTMPLNEIFDDSIGEALVTFYNQGPANPADMQALEQFLYRAVDDHNARYGLVASHQFGMDTDWEDLSEVF